MCVLVDTVQRRPVAGVVEHLRLRSMITHEFLLLCWSLIGTTQSRSAPVSPSSRRRLTKLNRWLRGRGVAVLTGTGNLRRSSQLNSRSKEISKATLHVDFAVWVPHDDRMIRNLKLQGTTFSSDGSIIPNRGDWSPRTSIVGSSPTFAFGR